MECVKDKGQRLQTWGRCKKCDGFNIHILRDHNPPPIPLAYVEKTSTQQYAQ